LPLVMCLLFRHWQHATTLHIPWALGAVFALFTVASTMPTWPYLEDYRDLCIPLFGALPLWTVAVGQLWRTSSTTSIGTGAHESPRIAA
jgi:hypothetical protein